MMEEKSVRFDARISSGICLGTLSLIIYSKKRTVVHGSFDTKSFRYKSKSIRYTCKVTKRGFSMISAVFVLRIRLELFGVLNSDTICIKLEFFGINEGKLWSSQFQVAGRIGEGVRMRAHRSLPVNFFSITKSRSVNFLQYTYLIKVKIQIRIK